MLIPHKIIVPTAEQIISSLDALSYEFYGRFPVGIGEAPLPYNLNIVAIRNEQFNLDQFDDLLCVVYIQPDTNYYSIFACLCTCEPGSYWIEHPMDGVAAAEIVPGQYPGVWELGQFHNTPALLQCKPFDIYRYNGTSSTSVADTGTTQNGEFGLYCHESFQARKTAWQVYDSSAGCIVPADKDDFYHIINLCNNQILQGIGNSFTFTLLNESEIIY